LTPETWRRLYADESIPGKQRGSGGTATDLQLKSRVSKDAGVNHVLLNPVFDDEAQMERLCEDVLPLCRREVMLRS